MLLLFYEFYDIIIKSIEFSKYILEVGKMEIKDRGILNVTEKVENGELIFCFLHDLELHKQVEIAVQLSNLTHSDETVLDMSPDDILNKACVALLFDKKGKMIASASMMQPQINSFGQRLGEIGSMFTLKYYQNKGCASYLVHKIDEWAETQPTIDGTYAFLNTKSPRSFAVNGYDGEVLKDGKVLNAAEIVPAYAFNLCRTICRNEHAIHLMDLELRKKELYSSIEAFDSQKELSEVEHALAKINTILDEAKKQRAKKFSDHIKNVHLKIFEHNLKGDSEDSEYYKEVHNKIINFYYQNFKNNLHCCDVVVAKLF